MGVGGAVPGETRTFGGEAGAGRVGPNELALAHTVYLLGGVEIIRQQRICRLEGRGKFEHTLHGLDFEPEILFFRERFKIRMDAALEKFIYRSIQ